MSKLQLKDLEVASFVTSEADSVRGGYFTDGQFCTGPTDGQVCPEFTEDDRMCTDTLCTIGQPCETTGCN